jgi:hypothetical protein
MSDDKIKEFLMIYGALQLIMLIPTFIGSWMGRREAKRRDRANQIGMLGVECVQI